MKIKSFLMIFTMLIVSPVLFAKESSSWADFCADLAWVKDSSVKNVTDTLVPESLIPSINAADVAYYSAPAWASFGLWYKGFKIRQPIVSTKSMYASIKNIELNKSVARLALKNSGKLLGAAYLTGLAWQIFGKTPANTKIK